VKKRLTSGQEGKSLVGGLPRGGTRNVEPKEKTSGRRRLAATGTVRLRVGMLSGGRGGDGGEPEPMGVYMKNGERKGMGLTEGEANGRRGDKKTPDEVCLRQK